MPGEGGGAPGRKHFLSSPLEKTLEMMYAHKGEEMLPGKKDLPASLACGLRKGMMKEEIRAGAL